MFVCTTEPHKLLEDAFKKDYKMSDTSIIAAVVAECERMRSAASAHAHSSTRHHYSSSSVEWKFMTSVSCQSSHHQHLGTRTPGTPSLRTQILDQFTKAKSLCSVLTYRISC